jgi:DNA-damage-inducible protein D
MAKEMLKQTQTVFEEMKKTSEQGAEYWSAREIAKILEYSEYRHFKPVLERAKEACSNSV